MRWRRRTHWMTPAAWGAFRPFRMVHARTSSGPPERVGQYGLRTPCSLDSPLTGEISDQIQARVTCRGDLAQGAGVDLAHTQLLGLLDLLLVRHGHEPLL